MKIDRDELYIQVEPKIIARPNEIIKLRDLAAVHSTNYQLKEEVLGIPIYETSSNSKNDVISIIEIIKKIQQYNEDVAIRIYGNPEILVDISLPFTKNTFSYYLKILLVCITLFLGAGLAIINFHEDVNMEESLKTFYKIVTGEYNERPLILQIPYSLGIGIGMVTFFNHLMKKNSKKEPSPLDVEMYLYSKNIDDYVLDNTKQNNKINSD